MVLIPPLISGARDEVNICGWVFVYLVYGELRAPMDERERYDDYVHISVRRVVRW